MPIYSWTCHFCGAEHTREKIIYERDCVLCGRSFATRKKNEFRLCEDCRRIAEAATCQEKN